MNMDFIRKNIQSCKTCYNKENNPSKCLGCVTHGDDISDFKLKPEIAQYLSELEGFVEIGKAFELGCQRNIKIAVRGDRAKIGSETKLDLMGWYKSQKGEK